MNTELQTVESAGMTGKIAPATETSLPHRTAKLPSNEFDGVWAPNGFPAAVSPLVGVGELSTIEAADPMRQVERIEALDRLRAVVSHEVHMLKSAGAGSLAVMLRPDSETELFVQLTRNGDQIEAYVRIEKGDSAELRQGWEKLQASLAGQQIRLLPLQSSDFNGQSQQRQSSSHDGHEFSQMREEARDGRGFGQQPSGEERGGREEKNVPERTTAFPSRRPMAARVGLARGRSLETWA